MSAHGSERDILLHRMSQLAEAVDHQDDWTGVTSATERRRRQNRLNSRAFRRRKAQEQGISQSRLSTAAAPSSISCRAEGLVSCWSEDQQCIVSLPVSNTTSHLKNTRRPIVPYTTSPTTLHKVLFPLSSDHLITLLQYNVLRACLVNQDFISRLQLQDEERSSTALTVLPKYEASIVAELLPQSLRPTELQTTIPHAAWIDILPHPVVRDNLIRITTSLPSSDSNTESETDGVGFDEDELWLDTVGGLFEGFATSDAAHCGGVVWSPPWDISGWELSKGFWRKYSQIFRGCEAEVLCATNKWRRSRGEEAWEVVEV